MPAMPMAGNTLTQLLDYLKTGEGCSCGWCCESEGEGAEVASGTEYTMTGYRTVCRSGWVSCDCSSVGDV